ncbi:MAG: penicillin-binding transpeptidase domain-containing protein [Candidatus Zixiibacteriota bacterium]
MSRSRQERFRLGTLLVLVCFFFVIVLGRLVHLQVLLHAPYAQKVADLSSGRVKIPAERGRIYDRHGTVVADNVTAYSLYAYPINGTQLNRVGCYLDKLYNRPRGSASKQSKLATERFRWIERHISDGLARQVQENAPNGLYLRKETQRIYPHAPVGQQVLGFTSIDYQGLAGVEHAYDSALAGSEGSADIHRDGLRNVFRVKERALVQPKPGRSLVLTIDWFLQEIVERELRAGVEEHHAKWGMAVFLDCHLGDILAIAHYDPEEGTGDKPVKLRAVTDQFEPGSVFKIVTAAALLDAGLVNPQDSVYCENGVWRIGRRLLHDDKKHDTLTFAQVIEVSSNIGIAKLALELSGEQLKAAAERFGFGQRVSVGLPGEISGSIAQPARWSDYTVASLAMGHAIAVTPLQMAAAIGAVANGGSLIRPQLLLGYFENDRFVPYPDDHHLLGQAVSAASAATLRDMLRGVVERGTAEAVRSSVVAIAGKTGTAQIPDPVKRGYLNKYMASFAGYFPADQPRIAGIVLLCEPEPVHYGGWTAGPVFREIAERFVVARPDEFPDVTNLVRATSRSRIAARVPDLIGFTVTAARTKASESGLAFRSGGDEGMIVWQYPPPGALVFPRDDILTVVEQSEENSLVMADLTGLSIRQAAAFLRFAGIKFRVKGNGQIIEQSIRPGALLTDRMLCQLVCRQQ